LDFLAKTHGIRESYDEPQLRLWLVPDYSKTQSLIIVKVHHSRVDGGAFTLFVNALQDNFDPSNIKVFKDKPFYLQIMIWLTTPFYSLVNFF